MPKILLAEDEAHLRFSLKFNLESEGYAVHEAEDGLQAIKLYEDLQPFAAIILDVQMPELTGFQVASKIREQDNKTQILMLTARAADNDRIQGFKSGADDYITKPFHLQELLLRVKRMVERSKYLDEKSLADAVNEEILSLNELVLNKNSLRLSHGEKEAELTSLEAECLWLFFSHPGTVLSRTHLLEKVWQLNGYQETRTVDATIVKLRRKLSQIEVDDKIEIDSVRGRGYRLVQKG